VSFGYQKSVLALSDIEEVRKMTINEIREWTYRGLGCRLLMRVMTEVMTEFLMRLMVSRVLTESDGDSNRVWMMDFGCGRSSLYRELVRVL
jgi:hypothetical protein